MLGLKPGPAQTVLVAIATAAVTASVMTAMPALSAAFDAQNAHKVDGKHAVACTATTAQRKNKLVATCTNGRFPNNIIAQAPNSAKLGGKPAADYALESSFHDSGTVGINADTGAGNSQDLLTVGPITYIGLCTDLTGGEFKLNIQFSSTEAFTIGATQYGHNRVEPGEVGTPQNLVFVQNTGSTFAFSDHFRVLTPSGVDHQVSVFYGVHSLGEDCAARVDVEV